MASRYELRSQPEIDRGAYVALPGTTSGEFVTQNTTHLKSKITQARQIPGCNPGRWIFELLNNCFTTCDLYDRARKAKLETTFAWQHTHKLVVNGNQTLTPVISAVCLDCHFHFVVKTSWSSGHEEDICHHQQAGWPLQDSQFPWHHLVWVGSDSDSNIHDEQTKYYPLMAREYFACSAPPCTFEVTLEVSAPRMPGPWVALLQDQEAIREELRIAKEQEPSRFEAATDDWARQAPSNLNTYLKNVLEAKSADGLRSISKRNKRFSVLFGTRCYPIFQALEFSEQVTVRDDIDEGVFTPKYPGRPTGMSSTTAIGTYRAYLEDVRTEVQCLIHKSGQATEKPTYCLPLLCSDLHCEVTPKVTPDAMAMFDRYKLLGVMPDDRKEMVVSAYKRQWELLPSQRKELIEALMSVANDMGVEELSDYAMTQSSVYESQILQQSSHDDDELVSQALNFLGLQPPNKYTAESLIQAFRQKLASDPGDATTAKSMLSVIAQASTDDTYQATLLMETDVKMSLNTAKVVLGLGGASGFGPEAMENARAKIDSSKSKEEKATYLDAMEAIADHTNSTDLKSTVADMRQGFGIASSGGNPSQSKAVNFDIPVGLENIGNTCYLNSLLQYLFTVKPVRDIALNYEAFKLDLTDENIKGRLLGGNKMQMDRGEAVVSQAFAQELSELFNNLESSDKVATRPSQRLANAVLLSTHTLLNDPKQAAETSSTPKPPPLPARPSPAPPTKAPEDIEMVYNSIGPVIDLCDTASSRSSQTLVDQNDDDSDHSYEKVDVSSTIADTQESDAVMHEHIDVPKEEVKGDSQETEPVIPEKGLDGEQASDVKMPDAEEQPTVDQKVLSALEHQKRSSGTDQQDVEEVMGSILNRLQAAIRPSSVDASSGIQLEKIMETFFVTTINYTKKFDENKYQQEISFDRSITAFPAPQGACSLYDALGRNFDQQIIEESKLSRYTAIKTLPPVLHVLIQRSQSMGSKNGNPVVIPETLFLDRYMDASHDSPEFQKRVKSWALANRISDLQAHMAKVHEGAPSGAFLQNYVPFAPPVVVENGDHMAGSSSLTDSLSNESFDFDGMMEDDFFVVNPKKTEEAPALELPAKPAEMEELEGTVRDMMDKELRHRQKTLEQYFAGESIPYRLHAVICHRGQLMSGHYWVWIHDFEQNIWRKYNDSNVEENRNTAEVLQTLSTSGEPYFLCYVRDGDKDEYVNVPRRRRPEPTDADGDVAVSAEDYETVTKPSEELPPPYSQSPGA